MLTTESEFLLKCVYCTNTNKAFGAYEWLSCLLKSPAVIWRLQIRCIKKIFKKANNGIKNRSGVKVQCLLHTRWWHTVAAFCQTRQCLLTLAVQFNASEWCFDWSVLMKITGELGFDVLLWSRVNFCVYVHVFRTFPLCLCVNLCACCAYFNHSTRLV